jgi:hypothetical protein
MEAHSGGSILILEHRGCAFPSVFSGVEVNILGRSRIDCSQQITYTVLIPNFMISMFSDRDFYRTKVMAGIISPPLGRFSNGFKTKRSCSPNGRNPALDRYSFSLRTASFC